jgi:hypothetical protein
VASKLVSLWSDSRMSMRVTSPDILNYHFKWTIRPSSITLGEEASFLSQGSPTTIASSVGLRHVSVKMLRIFLDYDLQRTSRKIPLTLHRASLQTFQYDLLANSNNSELGIISWHIIYFIIIFSDSAAQRGLCPPRPPGFLITHNDVPKSVELLLDEWSSTWQHTTDKHPCVRWDSNPRSQQASGRRPTL